MTIYIVLVMYAMAIYCSPDSGCIQTSYAHVGNLIAAGTIELIFEIKHAVKIYQRKDDVKKEEEKKEEMP